MKLLCSISTDSSPSFQCSLQLCCIRFPFCGIKWWKIDGKAICEDTKRMAVTLVTAVPAIFEIYNGVFETFVGLHFVRRFVYKFENYLQFGSLLLKLPGLTRELGKDVYFWHFIICITSWISLLKEARTNWLFVGSRVGWKCFQGFESEAYHPSPSSTCHSRWWGTRLANQSHNRRWW